MKSSVKITNLKSTMEPILLYGRECITSESTM